MAQTVFPSQLNHFLAEARSNIKKLGYKVNERLSPIVEVNTRYRRAWAKCYQSRGSYHIEVSHRLLFANPEKVRDIIYHEVCHTIPGCFNHGPRFKNAIACINLRVGTNIGVYATEAEVFAK